MSAELSLPWADHHNPCRLDGALLAIRLLIL